MKGSAYLVLLAVLMTAFSPVSFLVLSPASEGGTALAALDVCHSSSPALSASGSAPCISSTPVTGIPAVISAICPLPDSFLAELTLSTSNDRPPRS